MILWNALGLAGEAGEIANTIKKAIYHNHGLDLSQLQYELGDALWYLTALCTKLGFDLGDIMKTNILKLEKRYPSGYTEEDSMKRVDLPKTGNFDALRMSEIANNLQQSERERLFSQKDRAVEIPISYNAEKIREISNELDRRHRDHPGEWEGSYIFDSQDPSRIRNVLSQETGEVIGTVSIEEEDPKLTEIRRSILQDQVIAEMKNALGTQSRSEIIEEIQYISTSTDPGNVAEYDQSWEIATTETFLGKPLLTEEEWQKAKDHLDRFEAIYYELGSAGAFGLGMTILPLQDRYARGERTRWLYDDIMGVE